jgi:hypothetical protein
MLKDLRYNEEENVLGSLVAAAGITLEASFPSWLAEPKGKEKAKAARLRLVAVEGVRRPSFPQSAVYSCE